MLQWTKFFFEHVPHARPVLLLWDGHDTHIFLQLLELCVEHEAHVLQIPSHASHITQGADQLFGQAVMINCKFSLCVNTD